jgi:hypothetical protein
MLGVVMANLSMTVEAERNRIFRRVVATVGNWHDVMHLKIDTLHLMAYAASPLTYNEELVNRFLGKSASYLHVATGHTRSGVIAFAVVRRG